MFFCLRPTKFSALVQLPAALSSAFVSGANGDPAPGKATERERENLRTLLGKTDGAANAEICRERKRSMTSLLSRDGCPPTLAISLNHLRP